MGLYKRLKKEIWKVVKFFLIIGVVVSLVITFVTYGKKVIGPDEINVIIDSDSGNEIDDLYAITLALIDPNITVLGLSSAHWYNHPDAGDSSVYISQEINEYLLKLHDTLAIPHPRGANGPAGYWGDTKPVRSPAAEFILEKVEQLEFGKKLNIVTLGAVTNLATAIQMDTTIIPKIRWYGMALKYNDREQVWDKNEFNARNDLDGMDYLLNREGLETHIMTATTSRSYTFEKTETFDLLSFRNPKYSFLVDKWKERFPDHNTWIMWDVAMIHAIMNPDLVTEKEIWTPPENRRRRIFVYTWIDEVKMKREFRKLVRKDLGDISSDFD